MAVSGGHPLDFLRRLCYNENSWGWPSLDELLTDILRAVLYRKYSLNAENKTAKHVLYAPAYA